MVAVPSRLAVTVPPLLTVATLVLEEDQVTLSLVASLGFTVAVRRPVVPSARLMVDLLRETPVTSTGAGVTVTLQVALTPLAVVAVMVAEPFFTAVTLPLSTVATLVLEDFQVTLVTVASAGEGVTVRVEVLPSSSVRLVWFMVSLVAGTTFMVTDCRSWGMAMRETMAATDERVMVDSGTKVPLESLPVRMPAR